MSAKEKTPLNIPVTENDGLALLTLSAKKRFLKKYYRLARELIAADESQNKPNLLQIFPNRIFEGNQTEEEKCDTQIKKLMQARSSSVHVKNAFNHVLFNTYRSTIINNPDHQSKMLTLADAAEKLGIEYPSKNTTLHNSKTSKAAEYNALRSWYLNKTLGREDVIRLIKLADLLKLPRDLSDLDLSKCDLTGLDLRKTKFDGTVMHGVIIDEKTKLSGSTFSKIKMNDIGINVTKLDGSQLTMRRESGALLRTFKKQYQHARDKKINTIEKTIGTFFKTRANSLISNYAEEKLKNGNSDGENILTSFAHREKGGRSKTAWKNSLGIELTMPAPLPASLFAPKNTTLSEAPSENTNATEEAKKENPDLALLDF